MTPTKYTIERTPSVYPAQADTFAVIWNGMDSLSRHETEAEAKAAIKRYQAGDARRGIR